MSAHRLPPPPFYFYVCGADALRSHSTLPTLPHYFPSPSPFPILFPHVCVSLHVGSLYSNRARDGPWFSVPSFLSSFAWVDICSLGGEGGMRGPGVCSYKGGGWLLERGIKTSEASRGVPLCLFRTPSVKRILFHFMLCSRRGPLPFLLHHPSPHSPLPYRNNKQCCHAGVCTVVQWVGGLAQRLRESGRFRSGRGSSNERSYCLPSELELL